MSDFGGIGETRNIEDITDKVRNQRSWDDHECVYSVKDPDSGLEAIIAIHDTTLGPALGGTRVWPYGSRVEALDDVLRLSQGMTMKASIAGIDAGGGKAVIIADPDIEKSETLLRAYGRAINFLEGRFITGEDVGLSVEDADIISGETEYVLGTSGRGGDPAPSTALGVYVGMKKAARHRLGSDRLQGLRIIVQGLGQVGRNLVELLIRDGALLTVTDIRADRVAAAEKLPNTVSVSPDKVFDTEADIFSPCAMGGVISDETIQRLGVAVVAGSANNQLLEVRHGQALHERGILYAPDYVINAGASSPYHWNM